MRKKRGERGRISRRQVLSGSMAGAALGAIGCGGSGEQEGAGGASSSASTSSASSSKAASSSRASVASSSVTGGGGAGGQGGQGGASACGPTSTMSPEDLLAPIENIVVLCMENRSFDHYLGSLALKEGKSIDGLTGSEWNPDPNGVPIPVFNIDNNTISDPPHDWDSVHEQWDDGKNDGFVQAHAGLHQQEVMGYYVRSQLPHTYALSDAYAICDRYFASVLGPTWPNRFYLHGATASGRQSNLPITGFTSIFDLLDDAGITNTNYYSDIAWASASYFKVSGLSGIENFFADALAGNLPQFSILDPTFFASGANDDHPAHDVQLGQAFIASVYSILANSPQWQKTLFLITYDEHGGFFDHVPPPPTVDDDTDFAQLGFRVPAIAIGPYVRKGCTVSAVMEHVSVMKTAAIKWKLPMINQRVQQVNDLTSVINPDYLKNPQSPVVLPPVPVSMKKLRARKSLPGALEHPEMWAAAESGRIPRHLDRRGQSMQITEKWLRMGAELGAVKLID